MNENAVGLMLAPTFGYSLQQLWGEDEEQHQMFWRAMVELAGNSSIGPIARGVAARTGAEILDDRESPYYEHRLAT